jgi:hypothetical protein
MIYGILIEPLTVFVGEKKTHYLSVYYYYYIYICFHELCCAPLVSHAVGFLFCLLLPSYCTETVQWGKKNCL